MQSEAPSSTGAAAASQPLFAAPTREDLEMMLEHPELYDDVEHHVAVFFGEEWPEIPDDPMTQENLLKDASEARDRFAKKTLPTVDEVPAEAWTAPSYVEPGLSPSASSTRASRTEMAQHMKFDHIPCHDCGSRFPWNATTECVICSHLFCAACIDDGQLCRSCRPTWYWQK